MKLRIKGNSIRLRLGRDEVQTLVRDGKVQCITSFASPTERLIYSIRIDTRAADMQASFFANEIGLIVPVELVRQWASTDQVGISAEQSTTSGTLSLLVEKDFACIERRAEKDEDTFENPQKAAHC